MKLCRECGTEKPTTEYRGKRTMCIECEREKSRRNTFKYLRGISYEERDALLAKQGGVCAVCSSASPGSKKGWHVDHDHITGKIRGILCATCNIALGMVNDQVPRLLRLAQYLLGHQQQGATTRA